MILNEFIHPVLIQLFIILRYRVCTIILLLNSQHLDYISLQGAAIIHPCCHCNALLVIRAAWSRTASLPIQSTMQKISYYAGINSNLKADNNKQHLINQSFDHIFLLKQNINTIMFTTKNEEYKTKI